MQPAYAMSSSSTWDVGLSEASAFPSSPMSDLNRISLNIRGILESEPSQLLLHLERWNGS
jgi:hypothetical protein